MSDSVRPHRQQPNRLRHPWDSPGKNTGVGCHFLLQCIKVKSESEVAQSCPTPSDPMDCSDQAPLSMGFSRQEFRNGVPLPSPCGVPLDTKQFPYCRVVGLEVFIDCFIWFILRIMFYLSSSMNSQDNTKFCEKQTYNLLIFFFI